MTSKEALECIVIDLVPKARENNKEEIEQIEKDLEILEKLKKVLSNVSHGSSIMSLGEPDKNGLMNMTVQPKVSLGEEFDTVFFQCILDELGFEIVKKE